MLAEMRLHVVWIGRVKFDWVRAACEEYALRSRRFMRLELSEIDRRQGEPGLLKKAAKGRLWLLDPAGAELTSEEFARRLEAAFQHEGRELFLALGGEAGFSESARRQAERQISLSRLTFSHELARVMLLEQIYRAGTLLAGHPYPR